MKIQHVSTDYVNQIWPKVEGYIESALQHQNDYTVDQTKVYVTNGSWVLIVAVGDDGFIHGAATVSFNNRPNDRVAFITTIGGRLISNQDTFLQLKDVLKFFGATYIEGAARESIARLWQRYGLEEKYRIVGTKI